MTDQFSVKKILKGLENNLGEDYIFYLSKCIKK